MNKYKNLDKDLKSIRHKWEFDLYEENLESQKRIDKFYNEEDISENDMICRKYHLELYLNRRNILFFPIMITIIFGILVNIVFNKISSLPNFVETFQILQSIPTTTENMYELRKLYIVWIILFILIALFFVVVFFIPFPPLYFLVEFGQNRVHQIEYEIKVLEVKINEKINEHKKGKKYNSNIRKKPRIKFLLLGFAMMILFVIVGLYWRLTIVKILIMYVIGIWGGYFISKIDV